MYHDLQINRLRALVTVVELGGFRKAAEALHVTQPAVSQQIRQLGGLVKGPIFTSTGRVLELSTEGEELLGYARRIVALNDEAVGRFVPPSGTARLTIGVVNQLAEALPEILRLLNRGLPHVQVGVQTGLSESLENQVSSGQLDLALLLQSEPVTAPAHQLGEMRMDWFGRPAHGEGAALPLTLFTEPCTLRRRIVDALDASEVPWRVAYEGPELVGLRAPPRRPVWGSPAWWPTATSCGAAARRPPRASLGPGPAAGDGGVVGERDELEYVPIAERAFQQALRDYPFA